MDENKIAIILCVNNDTYFEECMHYLNKLNIPEGFQVDLYDVRDAKSIYEGYNEGMNASDAKYKFYMHQDVFILDPNALIKSINFFKEHPKCGLLGVVGGTKKPTDRFFYRSWDAGNVIFTTGEEFKHSDHNRTASQVYAVDGMFMMTAFDLPWRSDILDGWDMYDFSQSIEFHRAGYEVWIPDQELPWTLHDCGRLSVAGYDDRLVKFLNAYSDEFDVPSILATREIYPKENLEKHNMMMELKKQLKSLLAAGYTKEITEALSNAFGKEYYDSELIYISQMATSKIMEPIIKESSSYEEIFNKYMKLRFEKIRNTDFYGLIQKKQVD